MIVLRAIFYSNKRAAMKIEKESLPRLDFSIEKHKSELRFYWNQLEIHLIAKKLAVTS